MVELEKETRNSFLINRKPTEIEIYQARSLFAEIEEMATTVETMMKHLRASGCGSGAKEEIEEKAIHLLSAYDLFNAIVEDSDNLQLLFIFDIAKARRTVRRISDKVASLSSCGTATYVTMRE